MRKCKRFKNLEIFLVLFTLLLTSYSAAQNSVSSGGSDGTALMPLSELKEGMHGVARTVFQGDKPAEFPVEILGILPGAIGPKQDLIVGRLLGGPAERTSVFAG